MRAIIREYEDKDFHQTLGIAKLLPDWFDNDSLERAIPIDLKHQKVFVAEEKDKILGFITLFIAEGRLNIGWLGVHPEIHNHGIGKLLLAKAESYGRSNQLPEIATYTLGDSVDYPPYNSTREFYWHNGFKIYQRSKTDNESCSEEIKIKKSL